MTAQELAHDFFLGIRAAMTCPDVNVTEYEGVMAARIEEAIANEREACAGIADVADEEAWCASGRDDCAAKIANLIRKRRA